MKFGLRLISYVGNAPELVRLAVLAEQAGFDYVWFPHDTFMANSWVITSAVAAQTSHIQIGSVGTNPYTTNPAEIATYVATLDELSAGRAVLGLGLQVRPRLEEVCDTLPTWLAAFIIKTRLPRAMVRALCGRGWKINTTRLPGFLLLYTLASLKRWRRSSYRFARENMQIENWLERIQAQLPKNYALAVEIVKCADLIKGYGDTHRRGLDHFNAIMAISEDVAQTQDAASVVRSLRHAALSDEEGIALRTALEKWEQRTV